jgi:hypothetical protein
MPETARPNWTIVRLKNPTLAALRELGQRWFELSAWREDVPRPNDRNELSIDSIVTELLRRDESHRTRSRAQRRRGKPRVATGEPGVYTEVKELSETPARPGADRPLERTITAVRECSCNCQGARSTPAEGNGGPSQAEGEEVKN